MTFRRRVAVLQAGGPTAVLNTSLHGFVQAAGDDADLLSVEGGPAGLVAGRLRPLDRFAVARGHRRAGALLGAGRLPMGDEQLHQAVHHLIAHDIRALALHGGNGTMTLALALADRAVDRGHELIVVGVPKTVDNDLVATDRAPGYASAARFVARAVRDLADDQRAMGGLEDVRLIETLGRNVGWVGMAAHLARRDGDAPHLVLVPERPAPVDDVVQHIIDLRQAHGPVTIVIAEGALPELLGHAFQQPTYDRPLLGGVSRALADRLRDTAGYAVRADVLGMIQRSATAQVSPVDRHDAAAVGAAAAAAVAAEHTRVMVALDREGGTTTVPLEKVAGASRPVPTAWLGPDPTACPKAFMDWLAPLVADDPDRS